MIEKLNIKSNKIIVIWKTFDPMSPEELETVRQMSDGPTLMLCLY